MTDEEWQELSQQIIMAYETGEGSAAENRATAALDTLFAEHKRQRAEVERLRDREHASQVANSPQALEAAEREHDRWMAEHAALLADRARLCAFVRRVARIGRVIPPGDQYDIALLDTLVGEARALLASEG